MGAALTLVWSGGLGRAGEQVRLGAGVDLVFGREEPTLPGGPLHDTAMSRRHARVLGGPPGCRIRDEGSKNGTLVNGVRVDEHALEPGDVVRIGETLLVFHAMPAAASGPPPGGLSGVGGAMTEVRRAIERVAAAPVNVLVLGETGTGKELVAGALHEVSDRPGPLVAVNCASLGPELLESELFGHERGAFTGATRRHEGLFREADGGTLFLDEVADMPPAVQARLLRALQERRVRPVGGLREVEVDVRVVAATNRDLIDDVRDGRFRQDLYARLNQWCVRLPALRDRREDLGVLSRALLGGPPPDVSLELMEALLPHAWPLNVRGLETVLERARLAQPGAALLERDDVIRAAQDEQAAQAPESRGEEEAGREEGEPPEPVTSERLLAAMERHRGSVSGAARAVGLSRQAVYRRLQELGRTPSEFRGR